MTEREALKLALEALEANQPINYCMNNNGEKFPMMQEDPFRFERNIKAITACKQALAQPEQEPVAWPVGWVDDGGTVFWKDKPPADGADLYTTPPQRKPLSDEEVRKIVDTYTTDDHGYDIWCDVIGVARAIEAAHGIKE